MTWNYRIFRHEFKMKVGDYSSVWYGLHEVYYNDKGEPYTYAPKPEAVGDSIEDLVASIALMLRDAKAHKKAMAEKKQYYIRNGKKGKLLLEEKDFKKGGVYFMNLQEFEKEVKEEIDTLTLPTLPPSTNGKANPKNPRRKPRSRNAQ